MSTVRIAEIMETSASIPAIAVVAVAAAYATESKYRIPDGTTKISINVVGSSAASIYRFAFVAGDTAIAAKRMEFAGNVGWAEDDIALTGSTIYFTNAVSTSMQILTWGGRT